MAYKSRLYTSQFVWQRKVLLLILIIVWVTNSNPQFWIEYGNHIDFAKIIFLTSVGILKVNERRGFESRANIPLGPEDSHI